MSKILLQRIPLRSYSTAKNINYLVYQTSGLGEDVFFIFSWIIVILQFEISIIYMFHQNRPSYNNKKNKEE